MLCTCTINSSLRKYDKKCIEIKKGLEKIKVILVGLYITTREINKYKSFLWNGDSSILLSELHEQSLCSYGHVIYIPKLSKCILDPRTCQGVILSGLPIRHTSYPTTYGIH